MSGNTPTLNDLQAQLARVMLEDAIRRCDAEDAKLPTTPQPTTPHPTTPQKQSTGTSAGSTSTLSFTCAINKCARCNKSSHYMNAYKGKSYCGACWCSNHSKPHAGTVFRVLCGGNHLD